MCSPDYIHGYADSLLAVLLNPIHANICDPLGWKIDIDGDCQHDGLKLGAKTVTTIQPIVLLAVRPDQRVRFAILCALWALHVTHISIPAWESWAESCLSGDNTTDLGMAQNAAHAAVWAANAANAAANAAAHAAHVAAHAAHAAWAAHAAVWAAEAAVWAAEAAADNNKTLDTMILCAYAAMDWE